METQIKIMCVCFFCWTFLLVECANKVCLNKLICIRFCGRSTWYTKMPCVLKWLFYHMHQQHTKGSWWHYVSSRSRSFFLCLSIVYLHFTPRVIHHPMCSSVHWLLLNTKKKTNYPAIEIHLWWSPSAVVAAASGNNALTSSTTHTHKMNT